VMPPNAFLTDEQVAQLLTYLRQNFGNYAAGIKASEVAEVRARPPAIVPPR
jgi:mono/diheme cytochrome c family protein